MVIYSVQSPPQKLLHHLTKNWQMLRPQPHNPLRYLSWAGFLQSTALLVFQHLQTGSWFIKLAAGLCGGKYQSSRQYFVSITRALIVSIWRAVSGGGVGGLLPILSITGPVSPRGGRGCLALIVSLPCHKSLAPSQSTPHHTLCTFQFGEILWSKQIPGARTGGNPECFCFPTVPWNSRQTCYDHHPMCEKHDIHGPQIWGVLSHQKLREGF